MATLVQLRDQVRDRVGLDVNDPMISGIVVNSLINGSLATIASLGDFSWLVREDTVALVSGTREYTLATDVTKVRWVDADLAAANYRMELFRRSDMGRLDDLASGQPRHYSVEGRQLRVAPAPDATAATGGNLRVGVVRSEPVLSVDGSSPLLPVHYDDAVVSMAALRVAIRIGNPELVSMLQNEQAMWMELLRDNEGLTQASPRVRVTRDWGVSAPSEGR